MLEHVDLKKSICLENLMAFNASVDISIKMNETVNPQLLLHLKENVALVAFKMEFVRTVFVRDVVMIVLRRLAWEHSGAEVTLEWKIVAVFGRVMILEHISMRKNEPALAANVLFNMLQ